MSSKLSNITPNYVQNEPHIQRNCPLDSPGRILACLANIFTSVPLRIQKSKRHAAQFCLPCVQSPSSLWSCAGCVCVYACVNAMLQSISRGFSVSKANIFASVHPSIQINLYFARCIFLYHSSKEARRNARSD